MKLKELIKIVLESNAGLCLDNEEERNILNQALTKQINPVKVIGIREAIQKCQTKDAGFFPVCFVASLENYADNLEEE